SSPRTATASLNARPGYRVARYNSIAIPAIGMPTTVNRSSTAATGTATTMPNPKIRLRKNRCRISKITVVTPRGEAPNATSPTMRSTAASSKAFQNRTPEPNGATRAHARWEGRARRTWDPRREGPAPGGGASAPADGAGHGHLAARRQHASAHGPAQVDGASRGHHVPLHRAIHRDPAARGVQVVLDGLREDDRLPAARHERRGRGRERADGEGACDPGPGPAPPPRHLVTRRSGTGVNRGTVP